MARTYAPQFMLTVTLNSNPYFVIEILATAQINLA